MESPFKDRLARLCQSLEHVWRMGKTEEERETICGFVEEMLIKPSASLVVSLMRAKE